MTPEVPLFLLFGRYWEQDIHWIFPMTEMQKGNHRVVEIKIKNNNCLSVEMPFSFSRSLFLGIESNAALRSVNATTSNALFKVSIFVHQILEGETLAPFWNLTCFQPRIAFSSNEVDIFL